MRASLSKKLVLGTMAGLITTAGLIAPASAHRRHHHHHFLRWHAPIIVTGYGYGDCSYYRWKWHQTGSRFWKHKYFACIY